jgi:hypothetical protein
VKKLPGKDVRKAAAGRDEPHRVNDERRPGGRESGQRNRSGRRGETSEARVVRVESLVAQVRGVSDDDIDGGHELSRPYGKEILMDEDGRHASRPHASRGRSECLIVHFDVVEPSAGDGSPCAERLETSFRSL